MKTGRLIVFALVASLIFCVELARAENLDLILDGNAVNTRIMSGRFTVNAVEPYTDLNFQVTFLVYRVLKGDFNESLFRVAVHSPGLSFGLGPMQYGETSKSFRLYLAKKERGFELVRSEPIDVDSAVPTGAIESGFREFQKGVKEARAGRFSEAEKFFLLAEEKIRKYGTRFNDDFRQVLEICRGVKAGALDAAAAKEIINGCSLIEIGLYEDALKVLKKSVKKAPNYPTAYESQGYCYYQLGQFPEAATQMEKALQMDPQGHSEYHTGLATCYFLSGQKEKAVHVLEKAKSIYANDVKVLAELSSMEDNFKKAVEKK